MRIESRLRGLLFAVPLIVAALPLAWAGTLEKYQMQQAPMPPVYQQAPVVPRASTPPDVYRRFESEIRNLPQQEKERLTLVFQQRQQEALKRRDFEQVRYYTGLLEILARYTRQE
jgi:hypothetical protein